MESKIVYFENPGVENSDVVFRLAAQRAKELDIKTVLVASTTGATAVKAVSALSELRVIAVSHCTGFLGPDTQEFTEENKHLFEDLGGTILTTTHAFGGYFSFADAQEAGPTLRTNINGMTANGLIANTLRFFGAGMKVACEISMMAADSGLVRTDEDIIAIAGTGAGGRGADLAIVLKPVNYHNLFNLRVREILCKPHF